MRVAGTHHLIDARPLAQVLPDLIRGERQRGGVLFGVNECFRLPGKFARRRIFGLSLRIVGARDRNLCGMRRGGSGDRAPASDCEPRPSQ